MNEREVEFVISFVRSYKVIEVLMEMPELAGGK